MAEPGPAPVERLGPRRRAETGLGPLEYYDVGSGETLLFFHEWPAGPEVWRDVVAALRGGFRCLVPAWPYGVHRLPVAPDADLTAPGLAQMGVDLLDSLGVEEATLVGSGGGGVIAQVLAASHPRRVARIALSTGDALDNFPPRRMLAFVAIARFAPTTSAFVHACRFLPLARALYRLGCKRPPPDAVIADWVRTLAQSPEVRRDMRRAIRAAEPAYSVAAADRMRSFEKPALVAWAPDDLVFPLAHGYELAARFPRGELVLLDDCRTFVGEDQPERYAELIADLMSE